MTARFQICFIEPDPFRGSRYAIGARLRDDAGITFIPWDELEVPPQWRPAARFYRDALTAVPRKVPGPCFDVMRWQDVPGGVDDPDAWLAQMGSGPRSDG